MCVSLHCPLQAKAEANVLFGKDASGGGAAWRRVGPGGAAEPAAGAPRLGADDRVAMPPSAPAATMLAGISRARPRRPAAPAGLPATLCATVRARRRRPRRLAAVMARHLRSGAALRL